MIPKIHKMGKCFRAAETHSLYDKEADTNDRVAWMETHNLATNNPEAAWRVSAVRERGGVPDGFKNLLCQL